MLPVTNPEVFLRPFLGDFAKNNFHVLLTLRREERMLPGDQSGSFSSSVPNWLRFDSFMLRRNL
jgi:hypothetical protein